MLDSQSNPPAGLKAIQEALSQRAKIDAMKAAQRAEITMRTEGKHGFLYRERPPEEDPFQEDEAKRHKRLMNCPGAWDR